jgi:hypothetical protein
MSADNKKRKFYDLVTKENIIDDLNTKTMSVKNIFNILHNNKKSRKN